MREFRLEDVSVEGKIFKILSKMPYRLSCEVEILYMEMMMGIEADLSGELDFTKFADLKGMDFKKKIDIYDLLLTRMVKIPQITLSVLNDDEHEFQPYFKQLGDILFEKVAEEMLAIGKEKKKLAK